MTDFNKFKYVADKKEGPWKKIRIWKYSENAKLFFLVSPRYNKEEPLVQTVDFIETGLRLHRFEKYTASKSNICERLNLMWNSFSDTWEYDGNIYYADCKSDLDVAPWHEWTVFTKLGYHHGQLVWVSGFQYYPRVCFTKFEGFDKRPDWAYCGYTSVRNIKPVYSEKDKRYI